jgi:hypothetical protein
VGEVKPAQPVNKNKQLGKKNKVFMILLNIPNEWQPNNASIIPTND